MKKRIAIILLVVATLVVPVFADNTRVKNDSPAWGMDLEVIEYLPLKLSFAKVESPSETGGTVSTSNFGFQEAAEFRVNFKYIFLSAFFDYTYKNQSDTGSHNINPMFRIGGRIPVTKLFWVELFGGIGGYFVINVPSGGEKMEFDCFAFQLGLNIRFFLDDLISLNGGVVFMGAYPQKIKSGNVSSSVSGLSIYSVDTFVGIGFNFL